MRVRHILRRRHKCRHRTGRVLNTAQPRRSRLRRRQGAGHQPPPQQRCSVRQGTSAANNLRRCIRGRTGRCHSCWRLVGSDRGQSNHEGSEAWARCISDRSSRHRRCSRQIDRSRGRCMSHCTQIAHSSCQQMPDSRCTCRQDRCRCRRSCRRRTAAARERAVRRAR